MDAKKRRILSLTLSVLIHSALAIALVKIGVHYALPEGTVTDSTDFEVVGGNDGSQTRAVPAEQPNANSAQNATTQTETQPENKKAPHEITKAQQKMEDSLRKQVADNDAKFLPVKEPHDVVSDEAQEQNSNQAETPKDESPETLAAPKPAPGPAPEKQAEEPPQPEVAPEPEAAEAEQAPQAAEAADQPALPPAAAAANAEAAHADQAVNQPPAQIQGAPQAGTAAPPFGAPGTMLDERKLTERPGNRKPNYPWTSRLRRQEGLVVIRAFIKPDGHVDMANIEKSSGFADLDQEAIRAYSTWRYMPGASGWVLKPFNFKISAQ